MAPREDPKWLDAEVELATGWWFGADRWLGVRADIYGALDRLLRAARRAAPDPKRRERYRHLHDRYVESLPDWE